MDEITCTECGNTYTPDNSEETKCYSEHEMPRIEDTEFKCPVCGAFNTI